MSPEQQNRVERYMSPEVVTIGPDTTYKDAVALMLQTRTHSLVVVDGARKVIGIVSHIDILRYLIPDYLEQEPNLSEFEPGALFTQRVRAVANDPVRKFMTTKVHAAHPEDSLLEAATRLTQHGINQLPVVDREGTLVGYIGRTNVKIAIRDQTLHEH